MRRDGFRAGADAASRSLTLEISPSILHEAGLAAGLRWLARWMKDRHGLAVDLQVDPNCTLEREDLRVLVFQSIREALFNILAHAYGDPVEGARVTGFDVKDGRVHAVRTNLGTIACATVINCGGQWARQLGLLSGVNVPLHSAEHFYLVSREIEGVHPMLPVMRDADGFNVSKPGSFEVMT